MRSKVLHIHIEGDNGAGENVVKQGRGKAGYSNIVRRFFMNNDSLGMLP